MKGQGIRSDEATRVEYGPVYAVDHSTETALEERKGVSVLNEAVTWGVLGICLAGWAVVLVVFAIAEFAAFGQTAGQAPALYEDLGDRVRSICAIALRYLVMAATSFGLSAFHEPEPAGLFDPWWLVSLPVLAALAWRTFAALRDRLEEGAFWLFALVSFAPVCGVIPLPFPLADRYLYFILPGLIGGLLLSGPVWLERRSPSEAMWRGLRVVVLVVIVAFAAQGFDRAAIWQASALHSI